MKTDFKNVSLANGSPDAGGLESQSRGKWAVILGLEGGWAPRWILRVGVPRVGVLLGPHFQDCLLLPSSVKLLPSHLCPVASRCGWAA